MTMPPVRWRSRQPSPKTWTRSHLAVATGVNRPLPPVLQLAIAGNGSRRCELARDPQPSQLAESFSNGRSPYQPSVSPSGNQHRRFSVVAWVETRARGEAEGRWVAMAPSWRSWSLTEMRAAARGGRGWRLGRERNQRRG